MIAVAFDCDLCHGNLLGLWNTILLHSNFVWRSYNIIFSTLSKGRDPVSGCVATVRGGKLVKSEQFRGESRNKFVEVQNSTRRFHTMSTAVLSETDVLANQKTILHNQVLILKNQEEIKKNQATLDVIVKNQEKILAAVRH